MADVEISLQDQGMGALIEFKAANRQNTLQLDDGEYPQVRSLFPSEVNGHVEMNRLEILEAIKRSRLVLEERGRAPVLLRRRRGHARSRPGG